MRAKLRQQLTRQKEWAKWIGEAKPFWMGFGRQKRIPLTIGQRRKQNAELKVMLDRAMAEMYNAPQPPLILASHDFLAAIESVEELA